MYKIDEIFENVLRMRRGIPFFLVSYLIMLWSICSVSTVFFNIMQSIMCFKFAFVKHKDQYLQLQYILGVTIVGILVSTIPLFATKDLFPFSIVLILTQLIVLILSYKKGSNDTKFIKSPRHLIGGTISVLQLLLLIGVILWTFHIFRIRLNDGPFRIP